MKFITEKKEIQGTLIVEGQEFPLLSLSQNLRPDIPFGLRDLFLEFLVVIDNVARPLWVNKNGFYIIPSIDKVEQDVLFLMEEKEDEEAENSVFEQLTHEMSKS